MRTLKRIRLLVVLVAVCAGLSGCAWPFGLNSPNLPDTSGQLQPLFHCSQPEYANAYLELDVHHPRAVLTTGRAWVLTKSNGWVRTDLVHIKLVRVDQNHSLVSWDTDLSNIDWMGAVYQGSFSRDQVNTLNPANLQDQHFTQQVLVHPVAGQRYALYASLPRGTVPDMGCFAPPHPFLSL